ncbi:MAG TPA: plasmid pRiA4b ORF-3 family protein [Nostocaceae cyanobacterium]|nr:plasmid pRiA4b ORF-3 family protein [Nostocaceae cyanobacterium]
MTQQFSPIPSHVQNALPLTDDKKQILQQQTISQNTPGTILKDFQTILEFISSDGVEVSSTHHQFSLKYLQQLNSQLSYTIDINLKRPVQKSYPYIHGLYFLLRTSGLSQVISQDKKSKLVLDQNLVQIWQTFNPTEQYFTLLESWLIWGESEALGEYKDPFDQAYRCLSFWTKIPPEGLQINNYSEQDNFVYYPGLHNLTLLHLFGLIELKSGKPQPSKGWRFTHIKSLPLGDAIMSAITASRSNINVEDYDEFRLNFRLAFETLKPHFQPYFPEWSKTFVINEGEFVQGIYIFKATLHDAWRRIAIPSEWNLDQVAMGVVQAFDFDPEHLYKFTYKDRLGRTFEFAHDFSEMYPDTCDFRLGDLSLEVGSHLQFIFDLLIEWEFDLFLEKVERDHDEITEIKILVSHGEPPEQYEQQEYEEYGDDEY